MEGGEAITEMARSLLPDVVMKYIEPCIPKCWSRAIRRIRKARIIFFYRKFDGKALKKLTHNDLADLDDFRYPDGTPEDTKPFVHKCFEDCSKKDRLIVNTKAANTSLGAPFRKQIEDNVENLKDMQKELSEFSADKFAEAAMNPKMVGKIPAGIILSNWLGDLISFFVLLSATGQAGEGAVVSVLPLFAVLATVALLTYQNILLLTFTLLETEQQERSQYEVEVPVLALQAGDETVYTSACKDLFGEDSDYKSKQVDKRLMDGAATLLLSEDRLVGVQKQEKGCCGCAGPRTSSLPTSYYDGEDKVAVEAKRNFKVALAALEEVRERLTRGILNLPRWVLFIRSWTSFCLFLAVIVIAAMAPSDSEGAGEAGPVGPNAAVLVFQLILLVLDCIWVDSMSIKLEYFKGQGTAGQRMYVKTYKIDSKTFASSLIKEDFTEINPMASKKPQASVLYDTDKKELVCVLPSDMKAAEVSKPSSCLGKKLARDTALELSPYTRKALAAFSCCSCCVRRRIKKALRRAAKRCNNADLIAPDEAAPGKFE